MIVEKVELRSEVLQKLIPISDQVQEAITKHGFENGLCCVVCPHTTAGITINSPLDPLTAMDLRDELNRIVPTRLDFHHQVDTPTDASAHVKSALVGHSVTVPVVDGKLQFGHSQGILFCEFDGPRDRYVSVCLQG